MRKRWIALALLLGGFAAALTWFWVSGLLRRTPNSGGQRNSPAHHTAANAHPSHTAITITLAIG